MVNWLLRPLSVAWTTTSRVATQLLPLLLLLVLLLMTSSAQNVEEHPVHVDLLYAINMIDDELDYVPGIDGYPAIEIYDDTDDILAPTSLFFTEPLKSEFAILSTFKPYRANSGFLFAILNPFRSGNVVHLGVRIQSEGNDEYAEKQRVVLYMTPDPDYATQSRVIANFSIPAVTDKWTRLGLKVDAKEVKLYVNCRHVGTTPRIPSADTHPFLDFEKGSVLFLGQAWHHFAYEVPMFLGALEQLELTGTPSEAENGTCNHSF